MAAANATITTTPTNVIDVVFLGQIGWIVCAALIAVVALLVSLCRGDELCCGLPESVSGVREGRARPDGPRQLRAYRPGRMSTMGYLTTLFGFPLRGTVFFSTGLWSHVLLCLGWVFLASSAENWLAQISPALADSAMEELSKLYKNYATMFRTLTAFLTTSFVGQILSRWWGGRMLLASLIGNSNSTCMFTRAFVGPPPQTMAAKKHRAAAEEEEKALQVFKNTVARYICLAVELVKFQGAAVRPEETHPLAQLARCMCCRAKKGSGPATGAAAAQSRLATFLLRMQRLGRATEDESRILLGVKTNHYQMVLAWVLTKMRAAVDRGWLRPEQLLAAQTNVDKMRSSAADLLVYIKALLPFPYVQLVTLIVKFQVFLFISDASHNVELWDLMKVHPGGWTATLMGGFIVFTILTTAFFEGLLRLHELLANPLDNKFSSWNVEDQLEGLWATTHQTVSLEAPEAVLAAAVPLSTIDDPNAPGAGAAAAVVAGGAQARPKRGPEESKLATIAPQEEVSLTV